MRPKPPEARYDLVVDQYHVVPATYDLGGARDSLAAAR